MVTTGPGSKGTTLRRAVSKRRITATACASAPGRCRRGPTDRACSGPCSEYSAHEDGGEGFHGGGGGQTPGVEGAQAGDLPMRSMVAAVASRWSEQTRTSSTRVRSRSPSTWAGRWWPAAATSGRAGGRPRRRPPTAWRDERPASPSLADEGVGHRDHDLAPQHVLDLPRRGNGRLPGVAITTTSASPARRRCRRRRSARCRSSQASTISAATVAARSGSHDPRVTGVPGHGQAQGQAPPEGSRTSEDADDARRIPLHTAPGARHRSAAGGDG